MAKGIQLLRRPIRAPDKILDRFYVNGMEFLSLTGADISPAKPPFASGEYRGETVVFAG